MTLLRKLWHWFAGLFGGLNATDVAPTAPIMPDTGINVPDLSTGSSSSPRV